MPPSPFAVMWQNALGIAVGARAFTGKTMKRVGSMQGPPQPYPWTGWRRVDPEAVRWISIEAIGTIPRLGDDDDGDGDDDVDVDDDGDYMDASSA
ncbi:hypothetical protein B0H63DRAFT_526775 [Podospora didyma]|uniref:Uncharacterized protein n=1 Tax=Podospora didyma TaxID=330526 RepID=A0AAE0K871_9PEZI|nr:hypothetical protein B0H63DRAFT_526775 [Podospora didyma]